MNHLLLIIGFLVLYIAGTAIGSFWLLYAAAKAAGDGELSRRRVLFYLEGFTPGSPTLTLPEKYLTTTAAIAASTLIILSNIL